MTFLLPQEKKLITHPTSKFIVLGLLILAACLSGPHPAEPENPVHHHTNRLIKEKSPYLLQHAHNPVDWWPWCEEAFEEAKRLDKPVFLSVGYATCHWCHVMERESFENEAIAKVMNDRYVCIKVDREERPDVDNVYMSAVQMLTGQGGWPMSVWLTPDKQPFYGGTYFPPEARRQQNGFKDVMIHFSEAWKNKRTEVLKNADKITNRISKMSIITKGSIKADNAFALTASQYRISFDPQHGGFGQAPKFPRPHSLRLLMRLSDRVGEKDIATMVDKTLTAMADGGLQDHVGGGFHRYSVDREWLAPHFEKMLYDQALLASTYVEAWQFSGKQRHAETARRIFDYVLRDMTDPKGGFYSAEDADSEGVEGKFYVWSPKEVIEVLGDKDGTLFNSFYDITPDGNFEHHNIPRRLKTFAEGAKAANQTITDFKADLSRLRLKLFNHRRQRIPPLKDDKVLTAWNGLMIAALAKASRVLDEPRYLAAAEKSATFILASLRHNGRLLRRWRQGNAALLGYVDDYAFLTHGLVELYMATGKTAWLKEADNLAQQTIHLFWDDTSSALFFSGRDAESMITSTKESYDGALPSGNSVAALEFLRLSRFTGNKELEKRGHAILDSFADNLNSRGIQHPQMMIALDFANGPIKEIVLAGDRKSELFGDMRSVVDHLWLPRSILILNDRKDDELKTVIPWIIRQPAGKSESTGYVCQDQACGKPVTEVNALRSQLLD